jgi:Protein of unknown function (DUF1344)
MKRIRRVLGSMLPAVLLLMLVSSLPVAADSVSGKIQAVDVPNRMITLEDGTDLVIPPTVQVSRKQLKEGTNVKVTYEESGGMKVVRTFEVLPPMPPAR